MQVSSPRLKQFLFASQSSIFILFVNINRCKETKVAMYFDRENRLYRNNCGNSSGAAGFGNTQLFHRGCCHNFVVCDEDYYSPMQTAIFDALDTLGSEIEQKKVTLSDLKKAYLAINEETYTNTEQNLGSCWLVSMFATFIFISAYLISHL